MSTLKTDNITTRTTANLNIGKPVSTPTVISDDVQTDIIDSKNATEITFNKEIHIPNATSDFSALNKGQLLTEIKAVDGASSGLDADLVRGLPADFSVSKTTNGYQKFPSGLIIQWGKTGIDVIPAGSTITVTYPIAFPNNTLTTIVSSNSRSDYFVSTGKGGVELTFNATSFTVQDETGSTNGANWVAIGY